MRVPSRELVWATRLLFSVVLFAASAAAAPSYVFNDLIFPNPPSNTTSATAAYGINDSGTVVGFYQTLNTGNEKLGFYGSTYTGVSLQTLNLGTGNNACTPSSSAGVFPTGINNSGTIVGTASFSGTGCSTNNGFITSTSNGGSTFTDFAPSGVLPIANPPYSLVGDFATAINNSGVVVGYAIGQRGTSFPIDGYMTSDENSFTPLFDTNVGQTGATFPAGINASGEIVGFYYNSNVQVGFLLAGGHYYDVIPSISGVTVTASDASSIDSNGDIVGFYKDSSGLSHGFLWTGYTVSGTAISGGAVTTLDDPNAGTNGGNGEGTQILGISPDGKEIVGLYKNSNGTNGFYGMSLLSLSPSSGSGSLQTFTVDITDSKGYADIAWGQVLFAVAPNGGGQPYCLVHYDSLGNGLWLFGNQGFFVGPVSPGTASDSLQSSSCAIDTKDSSVSKSGNTITLNLAVAFKSALTGGKNVYLRRVDVSGDDTGFVQQGTWTVTAPTASTMTVVPNSGTASAQMFTANMADPPGFAGQPVGWAQMLIATTDNNGGQSITGGKPFCYVHYDRAGNGLWMYSSDVGYFLGPVTPGVASNALQSSACHIDTLNSSATNSASGLQLSVAIEFSSPMIGPQDIYLRKLDALGTDTGFQAAGTWTVSSAAAAAWVNPATASGSTQTFTATYWDPNGGTALAWGQILFAVASNGGGEPFCYVHYDRTGNGLWLYSNDSGFFLGPVTPGVASNALQSSACRINTAGATATTSGGVVQVSIPVTFQGALHGTLNTYERAYDFSGNDTGMQQRGTWVIP